MQMPQPQVQQPGAAQPLIVPSQVAQTSTPPMGSGNWAHGLCGCCSDFGTCIVSWFLPCCQFGWNKSRLDGTGSCGNCCVYCLISGLGCGACYGGSTRKTIREKSGIQGGGCEDCLIHCFCTPCALTQEKQQLDELSKTGLLKH